MHLYEAQMRQFLQLRGRRAMQVPVKIVAHALCTALEDVPVARPLELLLSHKVCAATAFGLRILCCVCRCFLGGLWPNANLALAQTLGRHINASSGTFNMQSLCLGLEIPAHKDIASQWQKLQHKRKERSPVEHAEVKRRPHQAVNSAEGLAVAAPHPPERPCCFY